MGKPTTVTWNGKRLEGRSMAFQPIHDHWNEYELENGGRLKVRVVLSEVVLVEDEKTATGDPLVVVRSATLVDYLPPETSDAR